jgi:hypothetical protein
MKTPKPLLVIQLVLLQFSLPAQVQWYQNQDGNNQYPAGTSAISVQSLSNTSFIACYLWTMNNDDYTWKISKTNSSGAEEKTFFLTGTTAQVDVKIGDENTIFVLKKNYPFGQNPEYIVYKLDRNLVVKAQMTITLPDGFNIFNLNAFETDKSNNVYVAGDGQYPDGGGFGSASFVLKSDKNLVTKWRYTDSTQTSFTQLHIDDQGNVMVVADFYTFFPDVHLTRISANGQSTRHFTIETDPGRYNLFTIQDDQDNLLIYGGKSVGDTAQAMFLYKFSRVLGRVTYRKTHFISPGSQLNDLKVDRNGNIFTLIAQYEASGALYNKISRINSNTGNISWNYSIPYSQDSCNLVKLVVSDNDRFFAIGQRTCGNYFSKGFALQMKKDGHLVGNFPSPDSVAFQRLHWLSDGIEDRNNRLIAVGGTSDLDTTTFSSSYLRAFAVRFADNGHQGDNERPGTETAIPFAKNVLTGNEATQLNNKLVIFPNPVTEQLSVTGIDKQLFDRITVYNFQGNEVFRQSINETTARIDASSFPEGVYLLVLRSSITLKEKSIKFFVNR